MGKFGWSYPAGCNGPPDDDYPEPSELVGKVLALLEEAGVPTQVNDQVVKLIEDWEIMKIHREHDEYAGDF